MCHGYNNTATSWRATKKRRPTADLPCAISITYLRVRLLHRQIGAGIEGGFPIYISQITLLKQIRKEDTTKYKSGAETGILVLRAWTFLSKNSGRGMSLLAHTFSLHSALDFISLHYITTPKLPKEMFSNKSSKEFIKIFERRFRKMSIGAKVQGIISICEAHCWL
jgi:hypothetical protein